MEKYPLYEGYTTADAMLLRKLSHDEKYDFLVIDTFYYGSDDFRSELGLSFDDPHKELLFRLKYL